MRGALSEEEKGGENSDLGNDKVYRIIHEKHLFLVLFNISCDETTDTRSGRGSERR
jgi:hypothetical protein